MENLHYEEKQMTTKLKVGASSTSNWGAINWHYVTSDVRRLQMRIAKATREGRYGKVKALQWLLTHSFNAKLLAIKRVTQNQGAKTPGIDGITWKTSKQKMEGVKSLRRRGYQTKPLKRIYIPKKTNGLRPLSIPTIACRAQQALYLLALEPVTEMLADKNSYGFRPLRSTADAIEQCFRILAKRSSAQYILECDIKACFDNISHTWLYNNIIMDKVILKKWLNAGYIEQGKLCFTEKGTPQGGIISPTLLVNTLSGLETAVRKVVSTRTDKVNLCIYADDFIITGVSKEVLESKVKPAVESFLSERGLRLSEAKTKITHIDEGFNFLGVNIRKYNGKCIIKPAKNNVKRLLSNIREIIKRNATIKTENLINLLNPKIIGWGNYYRHICAKRTFSYVDHGIFLSLYRWMKRRHPKKSIRWIKNQYFRSDKSRNWIFSAKTQGNLDLAEMSKISIKRYIKLKAVATPYNPIYKEYLNKRYQSRVLNLTLRKEGSRVVENTAL